MSDEERDAVEYDTRFEGCRLQAELYERPWGQVGEAGVCLPLCLACTCDGVVHVLPGEGFRCDHAVAGLSPRCAGVMPASVNAKPRGAHSSEHK